MTEGADSQESHWYRRGVHGAHGARGDGNDHLLPQNLVSELRDCCLSRPIQKLPPDIRINKSVIKPSAHHAHPHVVLLKGSL